MVLVPWPCPHQVSLWAAAAASMVPSPRTRMPSLMHSLRKLRCPSISSATFSGTVRVPSPSAGCWLFLSIRTLAGSWKGFLPGSRVVKETLPPVSAPSLLWLSLFFLSPLPLHASPFSSLLPLPLSTSLFSPSSLLLVPFLLVLLPQGYHGGSQGGEREY